jgi:hypothetical protein
MILIVRYDQLDRYNRDLPEVSLLIKLQREQNCLIVCDRWYEVQSNIPQPEVV